MNKLPIKSANELCQDTKNTLKSSVILTTLASSGAVLTGVTALFGASTVEDDTTKKVILGVGGFCTVIEAGMAIASYKKMNSIIENHDDVVKLSILEKFINVSDLDERDALLGDMVNELYNKNI